MKRLWNKLRGKKEATPPREITVGEVTLTEGQLVRMEHSLFDKELGKERMAWEYGKVLVIFDNSLVIQGETYRTFFHVQVSGLVNSNGFTLHPVYRDGSPIMFEDFLRGNF